jgi:hypothetical protein
MDGGEAVKKIENLRDLFGMDETLDRELVPYLQDMGEPFGQCLKHPLVFSVPYMGENGMLNQRLDMKRRACEKAWDNNEWATYMWLHERPYRLQALLEMEPYVDDDAEYWDLLASAWVDTENAWQNLDEWYELWQSDRGDRPEVKLPEGCGDVLTIYRGVESPERDGISWTLSYEKAKWFALRLTYGDAKAYVLTATVEARRVWFYSDDRGEQEVLAHVPAFTSEEVSND